MAAGRPRLPIGAWGAITKVGVAVEDGRKVYLKRDGRAWRHPRDGTPAKPDFHIAYAWVRDFDGRKRKAEARGRSATAAEAALRAALAGRAAPTSEEVTGDTTLARLWDKRRAQLVEDGRAPRTLDTYDYAAGKVLAAAGDVRVRELTAQRADRLLREVAGRNGPTVARACRTVLSGMMVLAVRYGAAQANPVRELGAVAKPARKRARSLTGAELRALLDALRGSALPCPVPEPRNPGARVPARRNAPPTVAEYARGADLHDVVLMLACTGAREGEVLGLRYQDVDWQARTIHVCGKVSRSRAHGLRREPYTKTAAGDRVISLPDAAVAVLARRRDEVGPGAEGVVFPNAVGGLKEPDNLNDQWRRVRAALGLDWVTTHTFRKTVVTIIDEAGLSARVGADHVGHSKVSMTQDRYMGRGKTHAEVAAALDVVLSRGD